MGKKSWEYFTPLGLLSVGGMQVQAICSRCCLRGRMEPQGSALGTPMTFPVFSSPESLGKGNGYQLAHRRASGKQYLDFEQKRHLSFGRWDWTLKQ